MTPCQSASLATPSATKELHEPEKTPEAKSTDYNKSATDGRGAERGCSPNLKVAAPSWRLDAGWKPAPGVCTFVL
jgi:hypothetical protein